MANEKVNKVILGNETLIDLTGDTVNANNLLAGETAHDASGNQVTGEFEPSYFIKWSEASKSVKKNLLKNTATSTTINGITFTVNSDGSVTANGTATADAYFDIKTFWKLDSNLYILSGTPSSLGSSNSAYLYIDSSEGVYINRGSGEVTFTVASASTDWSLHLRVENGATISNLTFYPMLRLASIADATYEPYIPDNVELNELKADKTQITNPNLLDNPWFTVNQRGLSSYPDGSAQYTIDRWKARTTTKIDVLDNGIKITNKNTSSSTWLMQVFDGTELVGETVTVSIKTSDGSIYSDTIIVPTNGNTSDTVLFNNNGVNFKSRFDWSSNKLQFTIIITSYPDAELSVRAIKLELGSISTLALDTAPNYQQELAKCMRYFQRIDSSYLFGIRGYSNAQSVLVPIPYVRMRTTPSASATIDSTHNIACADNAGNVLTMTSVSGSSPTIFGLISTNTSNLVRGCIGAYINTVIDLSADL